MADRDEMDDPAFNAIGMAVGPVTPPPALRGRILAAASRQQRRLPWSLVAAALVLISVAAFFLGQTLHAPATGGPATFAMTGHGTLQGATARVTDLKTDRIAVVEFNGMPAPPAGKVYELWLITPGGHADAAGVFVPDSSGHTVVVVDRSLDGYALMAVTAEQGPSGVSAPTQQPDMTGTIS